MSVTKGGPIAAADFNDLKALVKAEIQRRGKSEGTSKNYSVGSMANYATSTYDYSETPAAGVIIREEHIQKITQPLDAVRGTTTSIAKGDIITAADMKNASSALATLKAISERASSTSASGCSGACSGLCYSGCYTGCSSCSGCSGCGSCDNTCFGVCQNSCNNDCFTSCTGGCKTTKCKGTCTGSCQGCKGCTSCTGGCSESCKGCTSCRGTCSGTGTCTCGDTCFNTCWGTGSCTCGDTCSNTCWVQSAGFK